MADSEFVGASGLATAVNPIIVSKDAQYILNNMNADLPGWAVKRMGLGFMSYMGSGPSVPRSIWGFDDHLFANVIGDGKLYAYDLVWGQGWHVVRDNSLVPLDVEQSKSRLRPCFFDRRQLLPTSGGVKRIAAVGSRYYPPSSTTSVNYSTMYRDAGIPRALDPRCPSAVAGGATLPGLITVTGFEWLTTSAATAYRVAWIRRDENGILQIGAPSGRIVVRNTSTTTSYATRLKIPIPAEISDNKYVLQIYRTSIIEMDAAGVIPDPGDDEYLAGEYRVTSSDLSNKYILYEDVSFDPLLGEPLYTNTNQGGIAASRNKPPLCKDIANFGNSAFFSSCTDKQRMTMRILAVDSSGVGTYKGIQIGDKIVAGDLTMTAVAPANEEAQLYNFATDQTTGAGSEVIRALKTAESFAYKYNLYSNSVNGRYYAYNITTNNDVVGVIGFEEKSIAGTTGCYVGASRVDAPVQILPAPVFTSTPSNTLAQACSVATNIGNTLVTVVTAAAHNLTTGDLVFLSPWAATAVAGTSSPKFDNTDVPAGVYTATVTAADTFTFAAPSGTTGNQTDARAATTGGYVHKIFDVTTSVWTEARTKNPVRKNRLMWSPAGEPESAPFFNYADIGASDKEILRIVPTITSLFIFKEDGVWRLQGENEDWSIQVLDKSCVLLATETPQVVGGRIFCFTNFGVVSVDESGQRKVSSNVGGNVDNFYKYIAGYAPSGAAIVGSNFFAVGSDEDQSYTIFFTDQTDNSPAINAFRYSLINKSWSTFDMRSGGINGTTESFYGGCLYSTSNVGDASHKTNLANARMFLSTSNGIVMERKTGRGIDLCDADMQVTVSSIDTVNNRVTFAATAQNIEVGDVFVWTLTNTVPISQIDPTTSGGFYYRATITEWLGGETYSLNISGNVPTLANWPAVGVYNGGYVMKQIRGSISYAPAMAGGFDASRFSEVDVCFGNQARFGTCNISFYTDFSPASAVTSSVPGYVYTDHSSVDFKPRDGTTMSNLRTMRSGIPRGGSIAGALRVVLANNRAWEIFDVAGMRAIQPDSGHRVRKTNA